MWVNSTRKTIFVAFIPLLVGCGTGPQLAGAFRDAAGSLGGAVADEPNAVLVARDMLAAGGNAADAAVALYFALAATFPVAAGIGGGGVCLAHRADGERAAAIDFSLARMARSGGVPGAAPPGNVRGMAALHARFGSLRWERLVQPGERLARFGHRVSRALAKSIAANAARFRRDEQARAVFVRPDGGPLQEGDRLEQLALATVIGQIRFRGAGALHGGPLARRYSESAAAAGAALPVAALNRATPAWREPERFDFGDHEASMAPSTRSAELWRRLFAEGAYGPAGGDGKAAAVAEAGLAAPSPIGGTPDSPERSGTTGFAVIDRGGGAVACRLSMNGPFGSGRMLPGIGAFAPAPGPAAGGGASIALVSNANTGNVFFAAAASGGPASAAALVRVAGGVLVDGLPVARALAARRLAADAGARTVYAEAGAEAAPFRARGLRIVGRDALGRVNAIHCAEGSPRRPETCRYGADSRGFGLALDASR